MSQTERLRILEMIERGEITPAEGIQRMAELGQEAAAPESPMALLERIERGELSADEAIAQLGAGSAADSGGGGQTREEHSIEILTPPPAGRNPVSDEELDRWKRWWQTPLYVGVAIVLLGSYWMYSAYQSAGGVNLWFFCAWLPLLFGLLLILLAWSSREGTWLHVRVNEPAQNGKSGTRVAVSMPLPLTLAVWGLRNFGHHIPNMKQTMVDDALRALGQSSRNGEPLYIEVDDDGTHVEVYIG